MKAIVVFGGDGRHPLAFLLKTGWEHCFTCINVDDVWVRIDGEMGIPVVRYVAPEDYDLAGFYEDNDLTVVKTYQRDKPILSPLVINSCVGLVKAVLCIRAPLAVSPWLLYRHLMREAEHEITTRIWGGTVSTCAASTVAGEG